MTLNFAAVADLGQTLWADADWAARLTEDTVLAVASVKPPKDDWESAILRGLHHRLALQAQSATPIGSLGSGTYLAAVARFILAARHLLGTRYETLASICQIPVSHVESILWRARTEMAGDLHYLIARPPDPSLGCLPFDPDAPWCQRYVDHQGKESALELFHLQRHLSHCRSCADLLGRYRRAWVQVERMLADHLSDCRRRSPLYCTLRQVLEKRFHALCSPDWKRMRRAEFLRQRVLPWAGVERMLRDREVRFVLVAASLAWILIRR